MYMLDVKINGIMNSKVLLTIVIPSYNRKDDITTQVRLLLPQLTDEVRLIVVDNHSDYDIEALFSDDEKQKFSICVNSYNIGADGNIAKSFELCVSEWLWILSDDDHVDSNAVGIVLSEIKKGQDVITYVFHETIEYDAIGLDEFASMANTKGIYMNLFWMSVCVYHVTLLKDYMQYYYKAISTMQPGIVLMLRTLQHNPNYSVKLVKHTIHQTAGAEISWNREHFLYSTLFLTDMIRDLKKKYERNLFNAIFFLCFENIRAYRQEGATILNTIRLYNLVLKRFGYINSILSHGHAIFRHIGRLIIFKLKLRR